MSIDNLKKHVGVLANTGVRVVVVFRTLPNDPDNCLIVETDRLPDSYQDYVTQCLNSKEAMTTNDFYEVLNRRQFTDGSNCLTALHQRGFMRKEAVGNVNMTPLPGRVVPLALINAEVDKTPYNAQGTKEDVFAIDPTVRAKDLLTQAAALEVEAAAKRQEAYTLVPELKPGVGRPQSSEEHKAIRKEQIKARRLERDRENAAATKVAKREGELDAKVAAKVLRDANRQPEASTSA